MDYNTQRKKMIMPEYGRYVQEMLQQVKYLPDKEKRNEYVCAIVNAMGTLTPQFRDMNDHKQKLWDHIFVIADFDLDIDTPYPKPTFESFSTVPNKIVLEDKPLKITYYGRNIQNMAEALSQMPPTPERNKMVMELAYYMRKQYVIWNKDTVSDETIFEEMAALTQGKLRVPEGFVMDEIQGEAIRQAYFQSKNGQIRNGFPHRNKKRKKKPQKQ